MVNNLGVDPDEWFDNPLDKMPIATDNGNGHPEWDIEELKKSYVDAAKHGWDEFPAELKEVPTSVENPKPKKKDVQAELSLHEKMYRIATDKYNPFSIGGSENIQDFDERLGGGSEERLTDS
tara:strand:+ start:3237 stop:3602 length:366 start_codon:yes stop_codon:yes gene_type:complete